MPCAYTDQLMLHSRTCTVESLLTQVRRAVGPDAYNDVVHDTALVTLHACGMVVDKALAHLATINYGVRATGASASFVAV